VARSPEIDHEMGRAGSLQLLEQQPLAHLAYTGLDGLPRVAPISFCWNGQVIVTCTAVNSPRVQELRFHPRVALTIDADGGPASILSVRGVATVETVDGVPDEYIIASTKALDPDDVSEFAARVRAVYRQMARIEIAPRWARFHSFGARLGPSFLRELDGDL
jgi:Pyridoxamine 5'-phosphate oxidase